LRAKIWVTHFLHLRWAFHFYSSDDASVYDFWCKNYDVITQVNTAITRGGTLDLNEGIQAKRTAELLALRAYAYFNLVETYGGVPLLLLEITEPTFSFTRASEEDVYKQIVSDLETAIQSNGLATALAADDFGRVDLGMAKHLLGKVLLTRSYKSFAQSDDLSRAITYFRTSLLYIQWLIIGIFCLILRRGHINIIIRR
jgi:hypothetical protein